MLLGDPSRVVERVKRAVENDVRADVLLYELFRGSGFIYRVVRGFLKSYRPVLEVLATEKGREWLRKNVDVVLDYLLQVAR